MANTLSGRFFPVQTVHLGVQTLTTFNSATLPFDIPQGAGSTSGFGIGGGLGAVIENAGAVYRLVQFDNGSGNVAVVANAAAYWKTRASAIVTSDESDGEGLLHGAAGFFKLVVTDQYYTFVQIGGPLTVITDQTADIGDALILTTTDGVVAGQAAGSVNTVPFGYFTSDDGSTTSATAQLYLGMFL